MHRYRSPGSNQGYLATRRCGLSRGGWSRSAGLQLAQHLAWRAACAAACVPRLACSVMFCAPAGLPAASQKLHHILTCMSNSSFACMSIEYFAHSTTTLNSLTQRMQQRLICLVVRRQVVRRQDNRWHLRRLAPTIAAAAQNTAAQPKATRRSSRCRRGTMVLPSSAH
jgi:hypothetical protein